MANSFLTLKVVRVASLIALFSLLGALASGVLRPLDLWLYDAGLVARPAKTPENIVIVGLDEAWMQGRSPALTPRGKLARLLDILSAGRPRALVVDVWLDSRSDSPGQDVALRDSLLRSKARGVPVFLADVASGEAGGASGPTAHMTTLPFWKDAASGSGSVEFERDSDSIVRSLPPETREPSLAMLTARVTRTSPLSPSTLARVQREGAPLDFAGPPGTIPISPATAFDQEPLGALLLEGKTVLVGATYSRSRDTFDSPYTLPSSKARPFYGVELLAQATQTLVEGAPRFAHETREARVFDLALVLLVSFLVALLGGRSTFAGIGITLVVLVGAAALAILSARDGGIWHSARFHPAAPLWLGALVACALSLLRRGWQEARELSLVRDAFGAYVGDEVLAMLGGRLPELGGEVREVAVLFCDIRGFSRLAETLEDDPQALLGELNDHFAPLVASLQEHGAYTDSFAGDLVMAVWGAPVSAGSLSLDVRRACDAALECERKINERNARRLAGGLEPIEVGIGLHCGRVVVGNLGALNGGARRGRIHYTAVGSVVNIAARVEGATRQFDTPFLVTSDVVEACAGESPTPWEFVAQTSLKGHSAPVRLFKPGPQPCAAPLSSA